MPNKTAERLQKNIDKILSLWEERVNQEVPAARHQETVALRDSLPEYLKQVVDALSTNIDRTTARMKKDKVESSQTGKRHGEDRAASKNYTMDQLMTEYHILRQVMCDVLEEKEPLSPLEVEVIVCSIEQAVNDAATEFSDILKDVKERMSNTLAHDLRNPITSTRISAELVLRKLAPDDPFVAKMKMILNNMNRLDQMVIGLLDASRLEAGQSMPLDIELCDFNILIREVVDELEVSYPGCFKLLSQTKCEGFWDENGLRRIVENLITNAIKYGEDNTPITISLFQNKTSAELRVHNFGKAIPAQDIPILFEQYRRLKSTKDKIGWGLGLTMVKGMVEAHKGSIEVESDDDKGTIFKIKLPKDSRKLIKPHHFHVVEKAKHVEQVRQVPKTH